MSQRLGNDASKSEAIENVLKARRYLDDALRDLEGHPMSTAFQSRSHETAVGTHSDANVNQELQTQMPTTTDGPAEELQASVSPSQKSAFTSRIILTYV